MFFKNYKVWETELAGRKLTLETGKMCGLAGASIMARYGDTNVLCNVTMSAKPREGVDFFPLSVDYEEKMYSVGRIPGSFQRRGPQGYAQRCKRCGYRNERGSGLLSGDHRHDRRVRCHCHLRHSVGRPHQRCECGSGRRPDRHQPHSGAARP